LSRPRALPFEVDAADRHGSPALGGGEHPVHADDVVVPAALLRPRHRVPERRRPPDFEQMGQLPVLVQIDDRERAVEPGVNAEQSDHAVVPRRS